MIFQFKITLAESQPEVWRKIIVPADYDFYQFHMAIQGAFGWMNRHLFQFCENDIMDKNGIGIPDDEYDTNIKDAHKVKIKTVFKKRGDRYVYIYDLGDDWLHTMVLEDIQQIDAYGTFCLEGAGECPPEDCGGIPSYKALLQILNSPRHPEKQSYREWIGLEKNEKWNAKYFTLREVNKRMALLL